MKTYTVTLNNIDIEITQDDDGKFIKPTLVTSLESMGTAMKPAHEPCVLARKPLDGTVAGNCLKWGTGGLNIDGTRVGMTAQDAQQSKNNWKPEGYELKESVYEFGTKVVKTEQPTGRFPANLIHDGSDEVEAVFPQTKSGWTNKDIVKRTDYNVDIGGKRVGQTGNHYPDNQGSASRFFYTAKASKSERNAGLEGFEEVRGGAMQANTAEKMQLGGASLKGEHKEIQPTKNGHPTVKPLSLTKYLATLIKPPTGGRLLVPFSGSGSEMIGALQAGWEYVEGVELTEEYIPIAEARIKHWVALEGAGQIDIFEAIKEAESTKSVFNKAGDKPQQGEK